MGKLNETLDKLYEIIETFIGQNGYPPTVRELCEKMGVKSSSTIFYYLEKLEAQGRIKKSSNKNRTIELINPTKSQPDIAAKMNKIPLLGDVAAGDPILAFENYDEVYEISDNLFSSSDLFMLTIKGSSMINAGIFDGDKVVVRKQNTANNTDIVVAMINGSATVKRYYKEQNRIRLQPENDALEPIYCTDVFILGKVVGLIRKMWCFLHSIMQYTALF